MPKNKNELMTFKEFSNWANERACDGQWGMFLAIDCAAAARAVYDEPFWRRKATWRAIRADTNLNLLQRIAETNAIRESRAIILTGPDAREGGGEG